jgi:hypothetical protein
MIWGDGVSQAQLSRGWLAEHWDKSDKSQNLRN